MLPQSEWLQQAWLQMCLAGAGLLVLSAWCVCAVVIARRCRMQTQSAGQEEFASDMYSEEVFEDKSLKSILKLGEKEHWLLKPLALTLDEQSISLARTKPRGFCMEPETYG